MRQGEGEFHSQIYSGPRPRRLVTHTANATETSNSNPIMVAFPAGVVLTAMELMATAGTKPALIIGFRPGCSVMTAAIGGLTR